MRISDCSSDVCSSDLRSEHPDARWLLGRGWDQNLWNDKSFPTRDRLDVEFPDVPVYLVRIDGHAALANGRALELAGITGPADIEGGLIETQGGEPTGILVDNAMDAVPSLIPRSEEHTSELQS